MKRPARIALACAAGLGFFGWLVGSWAPGGLELRLSSVKDGEIDLRLPLKPEERFELQFYHSVNHMPVWEVLYANREGCIYIEETRFVSFSAGMDHWPGHGTYAKRGEYQVLENIHKPLRHFILRVGNPGADHILIWRNRSINLSNLAPGLALEVEAQKISLLQRLRLFCAASGSKRT
jgi:hypothetical protein